MLAFSAVTPPALKSLRHKDFVGERLWTVGTPVRNH
jgi:hypothetical protein